MSVAIEFKVVFGLVPGYGHDNHDAPTDPCAHVARAWRSALDAEYAKSGIVVGGVTTAGRVAYPKALGCPVDGEVVAIVSGTSNPAFVKPEQIPAVRAAVMRVVAATKALLRQTRVQVGFTTLDTVEYLEGDD